MAIFLCRVGKLHVAVGRKSGHTHLCVPLALREDTLRMTLREPVRNLPLNLVKLHPLLNYI